MNKQQIEQAIRWIEQQVDERQGLINYHVHELEKLRLENIQAQKELRNLRNDLEGFTHG